LLGFCCAALLMMLLRALVKNRELYEAPKDTSPPPFWIRSLLILTCTGVSFAHGSNDGQKGMGLIMLILVGTMPIAYALNRAMPVENMVQFVAVSQVAQATLDRTSGSPLFTGNASDTIAQYVRTKELDGEVMPALSALIGGIGQQIKDYGSLTRLPMAAVPNMRNDMYLASEGLKFLQQDPDVAFDAEAQANLDAFKQQIDDATRFIPLWVKIAVAIALGLGTMVGWKRIVVTVGEKIGKSHLTYAQGASAELVAMLTIGAADMYGLPVSTTQVLSSGVAGTMAASKSGLQWNTVRNLAMAWVLTLPSAMVLSGSLYWLFVQMF